MKKVYAGQVVSEDAPREAPALPERGAGRARGLVRSCEEGGAARVERRRRARRRARADG